RYNSYETYNAGLRQGLGGTQLRQFFSAGGQRRLLFAKREAHLTPTHRWIVIETGSRDHGDPDFFHQVARERKIVGITEIRYIGHDVVRAGRLKTFEACIGEYPEHAIALHAIHFRELRVIAGRQFQRNRAGLLQRRGGPNGQEIVDFADGRRSVGRRNGPADAPSSHAISFRHSIDGNRAVAHAVQRCHRDVLRAVVNNVLVNFVGNREGVPAHAKVADEFQLFAGKHLARGIIRRVDDDSFGLGAERASQLVTIEIPVRRLQLDESRRGAGKNRVGTVVFVVWLG